MMKIDGVKVEPLKDGESYPEAYDRISRMIPKSTRFINIISHGVMIRVRDYTSDVNRVVALFQEEAAHKNITVATSQ